MLIAVEKRMREWLRGGVQPCQGWGRGFESRLALLFFVFQAVTFPHGIWKQAAGRRKCAACRLFLCINVKSSLFVHSIFTKYLSRKQL